MTIETKDRSAVGTMSSERLPIVNIAPYLDDSATATEADRLAARNALDSACREFGFFYVTGHGLEQAYLEDLLARGHQFFELPAEKKDAIHIFKSQDGVRGYQKVGENVTYAKRDQQEALDIYPEPAEPTSDRLNGSQLWPSDADLPGFKAAMLEYTAKMTHVGQAFMRAMSDALGPAPDVLATFAELQKDNYWVLRIIGYPPLPDDFDPEKGISCGAHTDYGSLTFLLADDTPGALQVEAKDGSWIAADVVPGAFVVNIGDIVDTLTSHTYKSTYHRVIHKGSKYRVSMPFFFEPPQNFLVKPLDCLVPEGTTPTEPFTYFDHLKRMIYNHFVAADKPLPETANANPLTQRG